MSGQDPYFGQASWFRFIHHEKLPSAIERYENEVKRILGVLDSALKGRNWLVGDKMTYTDLCFAPHNERVDVIVGCAPERKFGGFDNVKAWHERLISRKSWKTAIEIRDKCMGDQGSQPNGVPKGYASHAEYLAKLKQEGQSS